jgi:hypothetical protein
MNVAELDENGKNFLFALFDRVNGDLSAKASMYEIGEKVGLDREAAAKTSEMLIAGGLVEIKTLSGGIGITQPAVDDIRQMRDSSAGAKNQIVALSDAPVLAQSETQAVEAMVHKIKNAVTEWGLSFDELAGVIADIKTIEIQLTSPAPKTAILRECFRSVCQWIDKKGKTGITQQIQTLVGK